VTIKQVLLARGYGLTSLDSTRHLVNSSTRFNIASLSKGFAATLMLKVMEEDGR
jgi:CubicO group peptidase (beta-lactamase class C family)